MKIVFYLNDERKKNLYCRINDGKERVILSLDYSLDKKEWDLRKEMVKVDHEYYFTLYSFKKYLIKKYDELKALGKDNILDRLKNEALSFMDGKGIAGLGEKLFDYFNIDKNIPKYEKFIKAFEKFSGLKKGQYQIEPLDSLIQFHTGDKSYEIDTYEGKSAMLKNIIDNRYYDEIFEETNEHIWGEIYLDGGFGGTISKKISYLYY